MEHRTNGQFYGQTNRTIHLNGITLTDTEYTLDRVGWHYHEHPHFTFILQGKLVEGNKKEVYRCGTGSLLFHNWQEPHYNIKPAGYARGFHIELQAEWISSAGFDLALVQGNLKVEDPSVKLLMHKLWRESREQDEVSALSIQSLVLQSLSGIAKVRVEKGTPGWVSKLRELLHDLCCEKLNLQQLANLLQIHPVHLSRDFPKYFNCGLGQYVRKLRIERSLTLLTNKELSLAAIAFDCGFADQSHYTRNFKELTGMAPLAYRKLLLA